MHSPEFKAMVKEFCKQPVEGMLYDLDLLPEQLKDNSKQMLFSLVIQELKAQATNAQGVS